jgi:hypothetical protein
MTAPPSRPEARRRFGSQSANELGAPVASSIPEQLPGHERVRGGEQRRRHGKAEHPRGLGVNDQFELARLHDRKLRGFRALEDPAGVDAGLTIGIHDVGSIADQSTGFHSLAPRKRRGNRMAGRQGGNLYPPDHEVRVGTDEQRVGSLAGALILGVFERKAALT